jgi:hypothetical protein
MKPLPSEPPERHHQPVGPGEHRRDGHEVAHVVGTEPDLGGRSMSESSTADGVCVKRPATSMMARRQGSMTASGAVVASATAVTWSFDTAPGDGRAPTQCSGPVASDVASAASSRSSLASEPVPVMISL